MMESHFLREMILWASGDREHSFAVPVDATVARMMFSGTFDATGGSFTLTAPDGTAVQHGGGVEDTPLNCGRIVTVHAPASGTWHVRMVPSGRFWLSVHAKSPLSLEAAEFVEHDARARRGRASSGFRAGRLRAGPRRCACRCLRHHEPGVSACLDRRTAASDTRSAVHSISSGIQRHHHASGRAIPRGRHGPRCIRHRGSAYLAWFVLRRAR